MGNLGLDALDRRIVYELEKDCGSSMIEIAKKMDISKRTLEYRLKRLIDHGVLDGFVAVLDYSSLGFINHEVWLQLREHSSEKKGKLLSHLISSPHVVWVAECGGKFDYAFGIITDNVLTFSKILREIISADAEIISNYFITITTKESIYPRSYLLETEDKDRGGKEVAFCNGAARSILNETDRDIISAIAKNANLPAAQIAKQTGVSANTTRAHIKNLEKKGVIRGYKAVVRPAALGVQNFEVLISTNCMNEKLEKEFEEYCRSNPYVTFMISCFGRWDLDIAIDAKDSNHFHEILKDIRTRFGPVIKDYEYVPIVHVHKFDIRPG